MKHIVIVGGGFAGIHAAKTLHENFPKGTAHITLISKVHHFEYTPALYRVVTGESPFEVCIPLSEVFKEKDVDVVVDTVTSVDQSAQKVVGESGSHYEYDYLILALGSETVFFNTAGMSEHSFGFKSINEALRLKRHLHDEFEKAKTCNEEEKLEHMRIVIIGGGASGTELAGELAVYTHHFGKLHGVEVGKIDIVLLEGGPRLLAALPEAQSTRALAHLKNLGVRVFLSERVEKVDEEHVYLAGQTFATDTIIWTAGVKPHALYATLGGTMAKNGRVEVESDLRMKGSKNIYILGDGAATPYAGMAQTAIYDGEYIGTNLPYIMIGDPVQPYTPPMPAYCVPAGPGWAVFSGFGLSFSGYFGYIMRKLIDLCYFMSILPFFKAIQVWHEGESMCETCATCSRICKNPTS